VAGLFERGVRRDVGRMELRVAPPRIYGVTRKAIFRWRHGGILRTNIVTLLGEGAMKIYFKGKMSTFGGPNDLGVTRHEGLALVTEQNKHDYAQYLLKHQPPGTTGLARDLNPQKFYIACRWDYSTTPKSALAKILVKVTNPANGRSAYAKPVDWGPNITTGRAADLSPGLATHLGLRTNDVVEVQYN
jgi:hypothetical protein